MSGDRNLEQAILEYSNGNFLTSEDIINEIWDAEKESSIIWNLKAAIASKKDNHMQSIKILTEAKEKFHSNESICLNLALSYRNISDYDKSLKLFKEALKINDTSANTFLEITKTYIQKGELSNALEILDKLKLKKEDTKELNYYYGFVYERLGDLEKAKKFLNKELEINPRHFQSFYVLGTVNEKIGNHEIALENYERSYSFNKNDVTATAIANLFLRQKRYDEAQKFIEESIHINPRKQESLTTKAAILMGQKKFTDAIIVLYDVLELFESLNEKEKIAHKNNHELAKTNYLRNFEYMVSTGQLRKLNESDDALTKRLMEKVVSLLKENEDYSSLVRGALQAHSLNSISLYEGKKINDLEDFYKNELLLIYIRNLLITRLEIENFLIKFRGQIIKAIANENYEIFKNRALINTIGTIAIACERNEYIWEINEEDKEDLKKVENNLAKKDIYFEPTLLTLLTFDKLTNSDYYKNNKITKINFKDKYLQKIKEIQIDIPIKEDLISKKIKSFGKINNPITKRVRKQYEENPYPRWNNIILKKEDNYNLVIDNDLYPYKTKNFALGKDSNILIAGCGSGQHAIGVSYKSQASSITAVDISLKNLSYAKRKSEELAINNIDWLHADILELENYGKKFECIESAGVLHHMEDPLKGFLVLKKLLKKNGIMKIGLYSKLVKEQLVAIKSFIKKNKYNRKIEDVREIRKHIKSSNNSTDIKVTDSIRDFYVTSEFVDLLLHEQEHFFTIDDLKKWVNNDFNFLGFAFPVETSETIKNKYIKSFPEDKFYQNLDNWDLFEKENPDTFKAMYIMYLQKK